MQGVLDRIIPAQPVRSHPASVHNKGRLRPGAGGTPDKKSPHWAGWAGQVNQARYDR